MAQFPYRANLSARVFPFVADRFGRSVIVQGQDQNFQRQVTSSEDLDKDRGIPQIYYCHNVMPAAEGLQSVGYVEAVSSFPGVINFDRALILRSDTGEEVFYSHNSDGTNFILPFGNTSWIKINTIPGTSNALVTTALINGQTYVYFSGLGCYRYDAGTQALVLVPLAGLDLTSTLGITEAAGYMIAWNAAGVAWSSTLDPTDFVPSLVTGAGGGQVQEVKGVITLCAANALGFIVYTTENAVAAKYSGNAKYPFNFTEIVSTGGVANLNLLSYDGDSGSHYVYTTSGLQLVSTVGSKTVFPEVTDFIAGRLFEDFNETSLEFEYTNLTNTMLKQLTVISDRYLVISYGVLELTHAIVYDIAYKRFGKLKVTHVDCFEWKLLTPEVTETPRESIGFLQLDGTVRIVDFTFESSTSSGVMILGKYQYSRTRLLTLEEAAVEDVREGATFKLYDLYTYDGKNYAGNYEGYLATNLGSFRNYLFGGTTGINHSLVFVGDFFITSLVLRFSLNGRV